MTFFHSDLAVRPGLGYDWHSMSMSLTDQLKQEAARLGFSMAGVVEAQPGRRLAAYHAWLQNGYHGQMAYLARPDRIARRNDPGVILPGVKSIVCVGLDYAGASPPDEILLDPARGRISGYAWAADYHQVMLPRLEALAVWLQQRVGSEVTSRAYVDTGAILERDHAETAGLGFTGKNTMLINPRRGSWFFLGELLTTVALTPDTMKQMPNCGSCRRCLDACPTAAFPEPYVLDARRCISYLTIELKGRIPPALRPLMGSWIYGCDICQEVCPFNRFAPESGQPHFQAADWQTAGPPLVDVLRLDEPAFEARFRNSPIRRIGRARLVRNACVAAGNWGHKAAVPALIALLLDASGLVRGHAAWALHQTGGQRAQLALAAALERETDEAVRLELVGAE